MKSAIVSRLEYLRGIEGKDNEAEPANVVGCVHLLSKYVRATLANRRISRRHSGREFRAKILSPQSANGLSIKIPKVGWSLATWRGRRGENDRDIRRETMRKEIMALGNRAADQPPAAHYYFIKAGRERTRVMHFHFPARWNARTNRACGAGVGDENERERKRDGRCLARSGLGGWKLGMV